MKLNGALLASGLCAVTLAGCGTGTGIQAPAMPTQSSATDVRHDHAGSWMLPEAKSENLMYVERQGTVPRSTLSRVFLPRW